MYLFNAACSLAGLVVWCIVVAAVVLALGGNLTCHVGRAEHGIVVAACQSSAFNRLP